MDWLDALRDMPAFTLALTGMLGLVVGSFLNVVIHRLPVMLQREWRAQCRELLAAGGEAAHPAEEHERFNLVAPRSRCPHCGHLIGALENVPIVSYLALGGRCRHCKARISARYPLVEGLTALLSVVVIAHFGPTLAGAAALLLTWALISLSFIDFDHQILPDAITLPLLWAGLALSLAGPFTDSTASITGALAGYLTLWSVYQLFKLATGKEGMGYGDFKLLAALGAWLGWQALPLTILLSALVGALVGVTLVALKLHDRGHPIPYGPYLAAAGWIALLWGDDITVAYLRFAGMA